MIKKIKESLIRQYKALCLLLDLLNEEYLFILKRDKDKIGRNELSIQNLLAQIFTERKEFFKLIKAEFKTEKIEEFVKKLNGDKQEIENLINKIMEKEQECKICVQRNADLVVALLDQTKELLDNLTENIKKQLSDQRLYSSTGKVESKEVKPLFFDGRC